MTLDREPLDPEVVADLKLRAATERERGKHRDADRSLDWSPPVIVGAWPCRFCSVLVDVPEETMSRWSTFNTHLRSRGEPPLDYRKVLVCAECDNDRRMRSGDVRRQEADEMARLIRLLKSASDLESSEARTAIAQLRGLHHPDVDGLVESLRTRSAKRGKRVEL